MSSVPNGCATGTIPITERHTHSPSWSGKWQISFINFLPCCWKCNQCPIELFGMREISLLWRTWVAIMVNNANVWTVLRTSGWVGNKETAAWKSNGGKTTKVLQTLIRGSALCFSSAPVEVLDIYSGKAGPRGQPSDQGTTSETLSRRGGQSKHTSQHTFQGSGGQSKQQQRTWCGRDPGARTFSE